MTLLLLAALDVAFRALWHPHPVRLPEQFSAAYLSDYVDAAREKRPVVVLGDSTLWGYHLPADASAVAQLARLRPHTPVLNLTYEGGSVVNSLYALRFVLARGIHPAAVLVNLNCKEFNPADSTYNRLQPSLERNVDALLTPRERARLATLPAPTLADRLDRIVSNLWAFYGRRVDIRVALFGFDDAAGLVADRVHHATGEAARYAHLHRPRADAFMGTSDLEAPAPGNVEMLALGELRTELVRRHIPAVAFLTPTNHALLRALLDPAAYDANLRRIAGAIRGPGIRVVNLDRFPVGSHFLDNDHLDASGSRMLARRLVVELDLLRP